MLTVEMEYDCTIITTLDETDSYEDVQLCLDETTVFITQYVEDTKSQS